MERPSRNILINYFSGNCTAQQRALVQLYIAMEVDQQLIADCIKEAWLLEQKENPVFSVSETELQEFKIKFDLRKYENDSYSSTSAGPILAKLKTYGRFSGLIKVAAAVLLIGTFSYLLLQNRPPLNTQGDQLAQDVQPGGQKALLTLADGSTISLTEAPNGELTRQAGLQVNKTADGEITYHAERNNAVSKNANNTIATPRGGHYAVTLPDGSKAWLNAASSLSYPVHFARDARKVKMTGEVYFEIAKQFIGNNRVPFEVETDKQIIQVLGTHFNVQAYADEKNVATTLLEGSVRVLATGKGESLTLRPGEQALLGNQLFSKQADLEQVMAWKNGDFIFKDEELGNVLRTLARWYDVDIECPVHLGKSRITGMIARNQPLSAVAKSISALGTAKLIVKERRILVEQ
ncbi:MAG: DUF4974 domain-containing protein [Sphingobacteriales bacterium]|nr:MAG: DUF4974 domain-containing protein [Sphingobacteriales bacterium]